MRLIPFERLTLRTQLPADDARRRLLASVEPPRWLRAPFSRPEKPFEGELTIEGFKISRVLDYRNSFKPVLVGTIRRAEDGGSAIDLVVRLNLAVAIFMAVWLAFTLVLGCALEGTELAKGRAFGPGLIPFGMLLFGYLICQGSYVFEAKKTKRLLEELLR